MRLVGYYKQESELKNLGLWDANNTEIYPELKRIFEKILPFLHESDMLEMHDFQNNEYNFLSRYGIEEYLHYDIKPKHKHLELLKNNRCISFINVNNKEFDIVLIPKENNIHKKDCLIIMESEKNTDKEFKYALMWL